MKSKRIGKFGFVFLVSLLAPGCAAVLVGGGATGGYYVGKDERSVGQIADDAAITASINGALIQDKSVSAIDINVDTYVGVVTLYGTVKSKKAEQRAIEIARSTRNVRKVNSKLQVAN